MSDGYYDPYPRVVLEMPLALVGHPGSGVARVARSVCGLTGLPFNDVARSAEAMAGCSRAQILLKQGFASLRRFEERAFRRAITRRPPGVISLDSALLEDRALKEWAGTCCRFVVLRRPMSSLLERVKARHAAQPGAEPAFLAGTPRTTGELSQFLAARENALRDLDTVYDAEDQHEKRVAQDLLIALEGLLWVTRTAP